MKTIINIATALVLMVMAAPSEAGTSSAILNDAHQNMRIEVNGGQFFYFGRSYDQPFYFGRPYRMHRSHGYGYFQNGHILPARAIVRSLRARRFCYISRPRLKRGYYRARARDAYGRRVRLVIDPYNGAIIRLRYR